MGHIDVALIDGGQSGSPPATGPTRPASTALATPMGTPGTARASQPVCRGGVRRAGVAAQPVVELARAGPAGTQDGSPGARPPTSRTGEGAPTLVRRMST